MFKNKPYLVILGSVLLMAGILPAQNLNWNITGAGARAVGFGGAAGWGQPKRSRSMVAQALKSRPRPGV